MFPLAKVIRCALETRLGRSGHNCNSSSSITTGKKNTFAKEQENLKENEMKTLRRLCAAFVLTLALSLSAFAGDMQAGVTAPPPPRSSQTTTQGEITTGVAGEMSAGVAGEVPNNIFLSLLQSLLALF